MVPSRFPSKLLENAVDDFASLPGIGRKTALRLVLNLLRRESHEVEKFGNDIIRLRKEINYCTVCHNISDSDICDICSDNKRDKTIICVVDNIHNVMAFENTGQYRGTYHVLGGIISPVDGIGPSDLEINSLVAKASTGEISEVILALSTTMEGDTTNFYLYRKLSPSGIKISTLARGVAIGDELEYTDEVTLGRSLINRTPFAG